MSQHFYIDCPEPDCCMERECWQFRIERIINRLVTEVSTMSTNLSALQAADAAEAAAITALTGTLTSLSTRVAATLAALQALQGSGVPVDPTALAAVTADLATHTSELNALATSVAALDPAAPPPPPALAATTTTLTLSNSAPTAGSDEQLLVVVDENPTGAVPTGTVTFFDGTTSLGTGTLDGTGAATFDIPAIASGAHAFSAQYSGDAANAASTSATVNLTV
jgi:hypothetical protein